MDFPMEMKFLLDVEGFQKIVFLHAALTLGIFEEIIYTPKSASQLAKKLHLTKAALLPLLSGLKHLHYVDEHRNGYSLTRFSSLFLVKERENYLGDYISLFIATWCSWINLPEVIKSGQPNKHMRLLHNKSNVVLHYYLAANAIIRQASSELLAQIDLSRVKKIIAGEVGITFISELLRVKPEVSFAIASLKEHKHFFPKLFQRYPLPKKPDKFVYSTKGEALKDMWGEKSEYDLVFLYRKLAFYSYGRQFLEKAHRLLPKGGYVIICEPTTDSFLHFMPWLLDAIQIMDMMIGGKDAPKLLSSSEIQTKLKAIGFTRTKVIPAVFGVFNFVLGIK